MSSEQYTDAIDYPASTAVDLQAAGATGYGQRPARALRALGSGTLAIKTPTSGGATREIAVTAGTLERIEAISIEASTDVAVRAYW